MLNSRKLLFLIIVVMAFMTPVASFGFEDWQSDLDTDNRGNLTVQQYDVYTLPYGTQGSSNSDINWNRNVAAWENRSIIFDDERLFREPYYATAQISTKKEGRNLDIIFYNNRANYGDASKQSLKAWGYFVPQTTGYYRFKIESDDGAYAEIYTNETNLNHSKSEATVLIDNMNVSFYNDGQSPIVRLEANKAYPIYLEYFNWGGDGLFTLKYAKSSYYNTVATSPSYSYVGKDMLYPSKKDDFFKQHGNTSGLVSALNDAKAFYNDYSSSQDPDVLALKNLIDKAELVIREYYNYSQEEIDRAISELNAQIVVVRDIDVAVKLPYPDDFLPDSKGKITVQTYDVKNLKSVNEADSSREENIKNWTNEDIIFSDERKNGPPELYTAETIKNKINAAENKIFFYDGGGDYGYNAKEAREGWGYLVPNRTGYYDFKSFFDDGIKAYIYLNETDLKHYDNERTVIADYYAIGHYNKQSETMYLEAGKPYPIYINHFNWHGPNKLAIKYRFSSSSSVLNGEFKDTPASWFYGSDKNDFLLIHGDKTDLVSKIAEARALLNGSNNLTEDQKSALRDLLNSADEMVSKYYNYIDVEFENMIKSIDDVIAGSTDSSNKIRKYVIGDTEYIEVIDKFGDTELDKKLWKSSNYGRSHLKNGKLYADPSSKLIVDELFNDYDHIVITVDQIYNDTVFKGGVGVTGNNDDIVQHLYNAYNRKNNRYSNFAYTGFEGTHRFKINNHYNFTTKITADKDVNGKYKVSLQIFDYNNKNSQLIYVDNYSGVNTVDHYLLNQIMLATNRVDGINYSNTNLYSVYDNFKIEGNRALKTVNVSIKDFNATTIGNNIKLTWATDDTDFDTFEIREIVDGNVVRTYSNIPKTQREKSDINIGGTYNNRVFEIIARKGSRYSDIVTTSWYGGIETTSVAGFNNTNEASSIKLTWDRPATDIYDGYNLYEIRNGAEVYIGRAAKTDTSYNVTNTGNATSRTFRIRGFKGNNLSNSSDTIWEEPIVTLIPKNFTAVSSSTGTQINLNWDRPTVSCDGYELYEIVNGQEKLISKIIGSSNNSYSVPVSNVLGDREFRVYIYKGSNKSKAANATWIDSLADISITGLNTATSNDGNSVILTWTKPQGDFDQYKLIEYVNGVATQPIIIDKNATSKTLPLNGDQSDRTYVLYAQKYGRDSNPATATWTNPIKDVKVGNFQTSNATNGTDIVLTWTKPNANITGYKIYEIINGEEVLVKDINNPDTLTTTIPNNNNLNNRKFRIYAVSNALKSSPSDDTWDEGIKLVNITGMKAADDQGKIKITWTAPANQGIEKFALYETVNGEDTLINGNITANSNSYMLNMNNSANRNFKIYALRGNKNSNAATCSWTDYIINFGASTSNGKINLTWDLNSTDFDSIEIVEKIAGQVVNTYSNIAKSSTNKLIDVDGNLLDRTFEIRAVKGTTKSNPKTATWSEGISLLEITDFKGTIVNDEIKLTWGSTGNQIIDGFKLYEVIDGVDVPLNINLPKSATEYTLSLNDKNVRTFKIKAYRGTDESSSATYEWHDVISTQNKDKDKDKYVDLKDNTKVTKHDSSFGIAVEINVGDNPIYSPSLEFMIEGNKYLTYENPKLYLYNSKNERISSKVIIEYDAATYSYKVQIIPLGLTDNALTKGTYYANLETKTIVNSDNYTQHELASIKTNPSIKDWELAYYINDIKDPTNGTKITDGLGIGFNINYKTSNSSTVQRTIKSQKIDLEVENKISIPGGY